MKTLHLLFISIEYLFPNRECENDAIGRPFCSKLEASTEVHLYRIIVFFFFQRNRPIYADVSKEKSHFRNL